MNSLNNISCVVGVGGNTNIGNCNQDLKDVIAYILTPKGTKFTGTQMAAFNATIAALMHNDNPVARAQMVTGFMGAEKANIEATTFTWGNGTTTTTGDERIGRNYQMKGFCLNDVLGNMNGMSDSYEAWPIFRDNIVVGTKTTMADGAEGVKGYSLSDLFSTQYDEAMNDTPGQFIFRVIHADGSEWRNRVAFRPEDGDIKALIGMQTVTLTERVRTPHVAGTYEVMARTGCGSINFVDVFGTEMLVPTLWRVTNNLGNVVEIDGITVSGSNFQVSLDTADANYIAGTDFYIQFALPSVLAAADIEWYESTRVKVKK